MSRLSRRTRLAIAMYGIGAMAFAIDRVTKVLAEQHLAGHRPIDLIPHVVRLSYTTNSGGAFGLFGGQPWLFFTATVVVCGVISVASTRLSSWPSGVGLGMVLGGALGNLADRILHGPGVSGRVTDFIDFRIWPVFNLADSAIVIGALIVVLGGLRARDRPVQDDATPLRGG